MIVQKCDSCPYFSKSRLSMQIHKRRHQSLKLFNCGKSDLENFSCENCDFTTQSITLFGQHSNYNLKHEEIVDDRRSFTKLIYSAANIKLYRRIYKNLHKCKKCSYTTRSIFFLLNHVTRHQHPRKPFDCENSTIEEYFCERCQFSTNILINFREHIKDCSGKLRHKTYKQRVKRSVKWYECQQCAYETRWRGNLKNHIIYKHTPEGSIKLFECQQCDYKSKGLGNLKRHITTKHLPEGSTKCFECQQCEFKTRWRLSLKGHIINKHTPGAPKKWFECKQCEYKTRWPSGLTSHIANKHTPEKPITWFECEQCEYKAKQLCHLKYHVINKHTPESSIKWLECRQCKYRTKQRCHLKEHVTKRHTPEDSIKWFECDQCKFKTKWQTSLKSHIKNRHTSEDITPKIIRKCPKMKRVNMKPTEEEVPIKAAVIEMWTLNRGGTIKKTY